MSIHKVAFVFGRGTLGAELVPALRQSGWQVRSYGRSECDITCDDALPLMQELLVGQSEMGRWFDVCVVNAAAYTNVDAAETHEAEAYAVNAQGAEHLIHRLATLVQMGMNKIRWASFVHVSTDAVYRDAQGKTELDEPSLHPFSVYGASKLAGERLVRAIDQQMSGRMSTYIVRTANLYGRHGKNWASTLRSKLLAPDDPGLIADEGRLVMPTWAGWVARTIADLLVRSAGVYHLCAGPSPAVHSWTAITSDGRTLELAAGSAKAALAKLAAAGGATVPRELREHRGIRWYQFARAMAEELRVDRQIRVKNLLGPGMRQADVGKHGVLRSVMLPLRGISVPSWREQLSWYLVSEAREAAGEEPFVL